MSLTLHRALRTKGRPGFPFGFLGAGGWRALAKGTAWAFFYRVIHHHHVTRMSHVATRNIKQKNATRAVQVGRVVFRKHQEVWLKRTLWSLRRLGRRGELGDGLSAL